jgi:hypothetical protein
MVKIKFSLSSLENRAFFCYFRVSKSDIHDLLRKKPSLFMLPGSHGQGPVSWNWMQWLRFMLHSAMADLSRWYSQMCQWCSLILVSMEHLFWPMKTLPHAQGMLGTPAVFKPRSSLMGQRNWQPSLVGHLESWCCVLLASWFGKRYIKKRIRRPPMSVRL